MMDRLAVFFGVASYEFRMQIRRLALWITFLGLVFVFGGAGGALHELLSNPEHIPLFTQLVYWTQGTNLFLPLAIGCLLADRLPRDRRTRVDEVFASMPTALSTRLLGKYLGSMLATIVPMFIYYCVGIGCLLYQSHDLLLLPLALLTFAVMVVPGVLFVSAFSIACPAILWVPLYQFLYVGYWFWGNLLSPRSGIPTLSDTILTPVGSYMARGIFHVNIGMVSHATTLEGVESILLLLGLGACALFAVWRYLRWEQARQ